MSVVCILKAGMKLKPETYIKHIETLERIRVRYHLMSEKAKGRVA